MDWQAYLAQLGIIVTAVPCIGVFAYYVGKAIIDRWFKAREQDYEHRLKELASEHQHKLDIQKETHIESLKAISKREEIRFSGLSEIQLKGIKELYDELSELFWRATEYLPGSQERPEKQEAFSKQLRKTWIIAHKMKIYFPKAQGKRIIDFIDELNGMGMTRAAVTEKYQSEDVDDRISAIEETRDAWRRLRGEVPKMLELIEDECRELLNVESGRKPL